MINKLCLIFTFSLIVLGCSNENSNHVAPIDKGATDMTSAGKAYEKYVPLFKNAAEIVRRDRKCQKVILIDISRSKSTESNPMFMVTCDDKNGRAFNSFLSYSKVKNYQPAK